MQNPSIIEPFERIGVQVYAEVKESKSSKYCALLETNTSSASYQ